MNESRKFGSPDPHSNDQATPTGSTRLFKFDDQNKLYAQGNRRRVLIIGSGVGALSAAMKCKAAGFRVTVIERSKTLGGKLEGTHINGRIIDSGPTVFTLRPVFDALFQSCGLDFNDYAQTELLDVLAHHFWPDGSSLTLYADPEKSYEAIKAFAGETEAKAYRSMLVTAARAFSTLDSRFMRQPEPSMMALFRGFNITGLLAGNPLQSMWHKLGKFFKDLRLQQLFARYATYCGSSPFLAPATLMLVSHAEQRGVWGIKGGMASLADALVRAAKDMGVLFVNNVNVETINTEKDCVKSLLLSTGEILEAECVIFGGDIAALTSGSMGGPTRQCGPMTRLTERSLSAMTFSLTGRFEAQSSSQEIGYHNVFFGPNYGDEFDAILTRDTITSDPTIYLCAPDRGPFPTPYLAEGQDSSDGPFPSEDMTNAGPDERIFMLINAPATGDRHRYDEEEKSRWFNHLLTRLAIQGMRLTPTSTPIIKTPTDFSKRFPATGGALYGRANHGAFAAFKRPGVRTAIKGLYLAGGSIHPSPGVPMASLSGQMAADTLISDWISVSR